MHESGGTLTSSDCATSVGDELRHLRNARKVFANTEWAALDLDADAMAMSSGSNGNGRGSGANGGGHGNGHGHGMDGPGSADEVVDDVEGGEDVGERLWTAGG